MQKTKQYVEEILYLYLSSNERSVEQETARKSETESLCLSMSMCQKGKEKVNMRKGEKWNQRASFPSLNITDFQISGAMFRTQQQLLTKTSPTW